LIGCAKQETFDPSSLEQRISDLETDVDTLKSDNGSLKATNADLAARLTLAESKLSSGPANTVYHVGDEVTISSYGYDLFKIKVNSIQVEGGAYTARMILSNINMPNIKCADYITMAYYDSDNSYFLGYIPSTVIKKGESSDLSFGGPAGIMAIRACFGFPNSENKPIIPYAVFQV
jgi:hypothetical protein